MVFVILNGITLNENGIFMTFKRFKEKYDINTNYVTYTGCVQAVKSYIHDSGLIVEGNGLTELS